MKFRHAILRVNQCKKFQNSSEFISFLVLLILFGFADPLKCAPSTHQKVSPSGSVSFKGKASQIPIFPGLLQGHFLGGKHVQIFGKGRRGSAQNRRSVANQMRRLHPKFGIFQPLHSFKVAFAEDGTVKGPGIHGHVGEEFDCLTCLSLTFLKTLRHENNRKVLSRNLETPNKLHLPESEIRTLLLFRLL